MDHLNEPIIANIPIQILYETINKYGQSTIHFHGAFLDKTKALKYTSPHKHLLEVNMYITDDNPIKNVYVIIKNDITQCSSFHVVAAVYPKKQDAEYYSSLFDDTFVQEFPLS